MMNTRIMMSGLALAVGALALVGCGESSQKTEAPAKSVVYSFSGHIDPVTGVVSIGPDASAIKSGMNGLIDLNIEQDGKPGTGSADTVELVGANGARKSPGSCGAGNSYDLDVTVRSFYAEALENVWVQITDLSVPANTLCNDSTGFPEAIQNGVVGYGNLAAADGAATQTWKFRLPTDAAYSFKGVVKGDIAGAPVPLTVTGANAIDKNSFEIKFNRLIDPATVDVGLIDIAPALVLLTAEGVGDTVLVTTEDQAAVSYTVEIMGVADMNGVELVDIAEATFTGIAPVVIPSLKVMSASAKSSTSVEIVFDRAVDPVTVAAADFEIDPPLAISAAVVNGAVVTVTTAAQSAIEYTIEVVGQIGAVDGGAIDSTDNFAFFDGMAPVIEEGGLFFSEYVEGSSNNKAIEIYNGTGAEMNLAGCSIKLYSNGKPALTSTLNLTGTLGVGEARAWCNASANADFKAKCLGGTHAVVGFNGDDALVLECADGVKDVFGTVGVAGSFAADVTLRRKCSFNMGTSSFSLSDWDAFGIDNIDGLGTHSTVCP